MTAHRRRWFQFRLSTALVLVAILAWEMACWPWLIVTSNSYFQGETIKETGQVADRFTFYITEGFNLRLYWSALAGFAFVTWRWAWPRIARWRERRRGPATHS